MPWRPNGAESSDLGEGNAESRLWDQSVSVGDVSYGTRVSSSLPVLSGDADIMCGLMPERGVCSLIGITSYRFFVGGVGGSFFRRVSKRAVGTAHAM